ncbi:hypothetical protein [Brevundimonas sp.]|uniref:hypothetical protein n=1 Tax=Brevundimonas sp. TaxID=1871086 RepID=UPI0028A121AC|nr:hypothetical protein [Brevundimonas sp.]
MTCDLDRKWFWMLHLTPFAPRAGGPVGDPSRNLMRSFTLKGGMQALLTRIAMAPAEVRFELQQADPTLVRISNADPLAFVWAGPDLSDLHAALAHLRDIGWQPATSIQKAAA